LTGLIGSARQTGPFGEKGGNFSPDFSAGIFPSATRKIGRIGLPWLSY